MKSLFSYLNWSGFPSPRVLAVLAGSALLAFMAACGGSSSTTPPPPANSTVVQVNLGDAPADWMLAFSMNVTSMSLTGPGGSVTVADSAKPYEMIHRMGIMEPIALVAAPRGNYTGASVTIASCKVSYVDPASKQLMQQTINGPFTATIPFTSSVSVGTTPLSFNFDLDLEHSVTMDDSGKLQFSPVFHHAIGALGGGNGNGTDARYGGMYQMVGVVSATSSSSFTIIPLQAAKTFTFQIGSQTQYQGKISEMAQLHMGMGVLVTATLQADGTMLASRVRVTNSATGAMGGGIITSVTGQPATQLTLVMQNGAGASVLSDYLSETLTVNLTDSTTYEIDTDRVSLSGLSFTPVFNASNIYVGQSVLPLSDSAIVPSDTCSTSCGTITATTVRLKEQGIRGTTDVAITPGASGTFVLTLLPDCAFTSLTGATEILVYQQTGTNVEDSTAIPAGTTLRVHGLLFNNGGQWTMIASTIASS